MPDTTDSPDHRDLPDRRGAAEADDIPPFRGPLQGLEDLSEFVEHHPLNTSAFIRGLTIGALVGAAVAGLSIWRRLRKEGDSGRSGGG